MKLYVNCSTCRERIYLTFDEPILERDNIFHSFSLICSSCKSKDFFTNQDVLAEVDSLDAPTGAIIGGLLGFILGPQGALIGVGLGGVIGAKTKERDLKDVRRFNRS